MNSRFFGYVVSSLFAVIFYVASMFCWIWLDFLGHPEEFVATLGVLTQFALFGGVVFLASFLPWAAAASVFPKARLSGKLYFTIVGAMSPYVDSLLEELSGSDCQTLGKFVKDSQPALSLDKPMPDLREWESAPPSLGRRLQQPPNGGRRGDQTARHRG